MGRGWRHPDHWLELAAICTIAAVALFAALAFAAPASAQEGGAEAGAAAETAAPTQDDPPAADGETQDPPPPADDPAPPDDGAGSEPAPTEPAPEEPGPEEPAPEPAPEPPAEEPVDDGAAVEEKTSCDTECAAAAAETPTDAPATVQPAPAPAAPAPAPAPIVTLAAAAEPPAKEITLELAVEAAGGPSAVGSLELVALEPLRPAHLADLVLAPEEGDTTTTSARGEPDSPAAIVSPESSALVWNPDPLGTATVDPTGALAAERAVAAPPPQAEREPEESRPAEPRLEPIGGGPASRNGLRSHSGVSGGAAADQGGRILALPVPSAELPVPDFPQPVAARVEVRASLTVVVPLQRPG